MAAVGSSRVWPCVSRALCIQKRSPCCRFADSARRMLPTLWASFFFFSYFFKSHLQVQSAFCEWVTTSRLVACHAGPCTPHPCGRPWGSTSWDRAPARATAWPSMPSCSPARPDGGCLCHVPCGGCRVACRKTVSRLGASSRGTI